MNVNSRRPEDYGTNYSPLTEAELWIVDEPPKPGLRALARKIRDVLRRGWWARHDANDAEAEQA